MLTRHAPAVLLAVVGYAAVSMAFAQTQSSHSPPPQSQAGTSGQASGESAAHAGSSRTQLAGDSSVDAVLATPVDSRRSKPGDAVRARTTEPAHTDDGRFIPRAVRSSDMFRRRTRAPRARRVPPSGSSSTRP